MADVPQGFEVERFKTDRLSWQESSEDEVAEPGLSRVHTWKRDLHLLTLATGQTVSVPRQHGVFEVLRWENRRVLEYDPSSWELWTPKAARLPLLQERAVVLCSGVLARDETREGRVGLKHYNVPPDIAHRIAEKLDPGDSRVSDPLTIFEELKSQYLRYYDTPFAMRDESLMRERRQLLERDAVISGSMDRTGRTVRSACRSRSQNHAPSPQTHRSPNSPHSATTPAAHLRTHQFEAMQAAAEASMWSSRRGTGSGKTEAFLLSTLRGSTE
ncbi:MAG: hypothetical protein U0R24_09975 [Solirubrobacterales bacterium]